MTARQLLFRDDARHRILRGVSLLAIPLTLLAALSALNQWVGYYPTVQSAWGAVTAGPLPDRFGLWRSHLDPSSPAGRSTA